MTAVSIGASLKHRELEASQDRKVGPRGWWQVLRHRWVPTVLNSFGLPAGESCPGKTFWCMMVCYACNSENSQHVRKKLERNFYLLLEAEAVGGSEAMAELLRVLISKTRRSFLRKSVKPEDWVFRIHWSGDFFSIAYAQAWIIVMRENPDIKFWAYTRSITPDLNVVPVMAEAALKNFVLYISADSENFELAYQVADQYGLLLAPTGKNFEHGRQLARGRTAVICPENLGTYPLMGPDKEDPQNGRGACLICRICIDGKANVIFAEDKSRMRNDPTLFTKTEVTVEPPPPPERHCRYAACGKQIEGNGNKEFCDSDCRLAEYRLRQGHRPRVKREPTQLAIKLPGHENRNRCYSDEELLEHLRKVTRELGKRPAEIDLHNYRRVNGSQFPSFGAYKRFGGLTQARMEARVDVILAELKAQPADSY